MALDARTRSSICGKLEPILGEEDANALMSEFPSLEGDELVTEQFLRAAMAELRMEFAELGTDSAGLRTEVRGDVASVRSEIHDLRAEMLERFHRQTSWFGGALGAATALLGRHRPAQLTAVPISDRGGERRSP